MLRALPTGWLRLRERDRVRAHAAWRKENSFKEKRVLVSGLNYSIISKTWLHGVVELMDHLASCLSRDQDLREDAEIHLQGPAVARRSAMAELNHNSSTVLGLDAVFKGQLEFEKDVRLLGKFEGEINSGDHLVIEEGGTLTGNAKAANICVLGQVKGNLDAAQKLELKSSARIEGDLTTTRLEVAEGAVLVGHCSVGVNGQSRSKGDTKAATPPAQAEAGQSESSDPTPKSAGGKK
jgi:cytoskeletal protein CcmA (bactofilin family)